MPILNPEHLLEQAEQLSTPEGRGRPRQVDIRRAISSAYYAVFHRVLQGAADEFIGGVNRATREYGLVSRSVDHATIKRVCQELAKQTPSAPYAGYLPPGGFGSKLQAFFDVFPNLQEERHSADYDPLRTFLTSDAEDALRLARLAINRLDRARAENRRTFFFLLLFPPRR